MRKWIKAAWLIIKHKHISLYSFYGTVRFMDVYPLCTKRYLFTRLWECDNFIVISWGAKENITITSLSETEFQKQKDTPQYAS